MLKVVTPTREGEMDIDRFLDGLGAGAGWIVQHGQVAAGVLVALIIMAFLMNGRRQD